MSDDDETTTAGEDPKPGTKAALEAENERLRGELAAARAGAGAASPARVQLGRPTDRDGNPVLSEGERQALLTEGVVNSPFDGRPVLASDHGIEPVTEAGKARLAEAKSGKGAGREPILGVDYIAPATADQARGVMDPRATSQG